VGNIIVFINHKGGVGKSTSATNVAAILASKFGKKVLVIDCDGQKNSSSKIIDIKDIDSNKSLYSLWTKREFRVTDAIYTTNMKNLFLIPGDTRLHNLGDSDFDILEEDVLNPRLILKERIKRLKRAFDYIILDSQPSLSFVTYSTLYAADSYIIPTDMDPDSNIGIRAIKRVVATLNKTKSAKIKDAGILICNLAKANSSTMKDLRADLDAEFGDQILPVSIPSDVRVKGASKKKTPIYCLSPGNPVSKAYLKATSHIIEVTS